MNLALIPSTLKILNFFDWGRRDLNPHDQFSHQILSLMCLPFHHVPHLKTVSRFELENEGFAIQSLTTWLYRLLTLYYDTIIPLKQKIKQLVINLNQLIIMINTLLLKYYF